jgi:hypothetical protein
MGTTAMQEMLAYIRSTLPMDLDWPRMLESKAEELLKKEKQKMFHCFNAGADRVCDKEFNQWFDKTYNQNK